MALGLGEIKKYNCLNCGRKLLLQQHRLNDGSAMCDQCFYMLRIDKDFPIDKYRSSDRNGILLRLQEVEDRCGIHFCPWYSNYDELSIEQADSLGFDKAFNITKQYGSLIFNDANGLFAKGRGKDWNFIYKNEEYTYKDILSFELLCDGYSEMKGGVGMALVGGALLGTVGAIAGSSTRQHSAKVNNLSIKIVTKHSTLFFPFIRGVVEKGTFQYKNAFESAHKAMGKLQQIADIRQSLQKNESTFNEPSIVDNLMKLQTLLENGIITNSELEKAKAKLLNDNNNHAVVKFCANCGDKLLNDALFCSHCGSSTTGS